MTQTKASKEVKGSPVEGSGPVRTGRSIYPSWWKSDSRRGTNAGNPVAVPAKVKIVRRVFELAQQKYGAATISRLLNDEGVKTLGKGDRRAEKWSPSLVSALLKNPSVTGIHRSRTGESCAMYPAIIEPAAFEEVQQLIRSRDATNSRRYKGLVVNLFPGHFQCGECGEEAHLSSSGFRNRHLRCVVASGRKVGNCEAPAFPYNLIESAIVNWLLNVEEQDLSPTETLFDPLPLLQAELDQKRTELGRYWEIVATSHHGIVSVGSATERIEKHEEDIKRLLAEVDSASRPASPVRRWYAALDLLKEYEEQKARMPAALDGINYKIAGKMPADVKRYQDLRERLRTTFSQLITRIVLRTDKLTTFSSSDNDGIGTWLWLVVYGDIVTQSKAEGGEGRWGYTEDGGMLIEYELPEPG